VLDLTHQVPKERAHDLLLNLPLARQH